MRCRPVLLALLIAVVIAGGPIAAGGTERLRAVMNKADASGSGERLGEVTVTADDDGALFELDLQNLPPGPHGFIAYENPSCGTIVLNGVHIQAGAAGNHLDPDLTRRHRGPEGDGHLGDLPMLRAAADGKVRQSLLAPRIKDLDELRGHSLVIHGGPDSYSDTPSLNGGSGARLACGVLQ